MDIEEKDKMNGFDSSCEIDNIEINGIEVFCDERISGESENSDSPLVATIREICSDVYEELGPGFVESIYEKGIAVAFRERGIDYENQFIIPIYYRNHCVGFHKPDFVVEKVAILEIKSLDYWRDSQKKKTEQQVKRYLRTINRKNPIINPNPGTVNFEPNSFIGICVNFGYEEMNLDVIKE